MKVLLGIQARTHSTRFPRKVFSLLGGKPILQHVIDACRIRVLPKFIEIETAVLCPEDDEPVKEFCGKVGVKCYAPGVSEGNLVGRYILATKEAGADAAVRITADCPFILPDTISKVIVGLGSADYASNTIFRSWEEGQDCQAATLKAWEWWDSTKYSKEHPWKDFDENQIVRTEFVNAGFKYVPIVTVNPIFNKTSIDTEEDLKRAEVRYARRT